jgi:hypothetical protein
MVGVAALLITLCALYLGVFIWRRKGQKVTPFHRSVAIEARVPTTMTLDSEEHIPNTERATTEDAAMSVKQYYAKQLSSSRSNRKK